jgi:uncharacterized protein
MAAIFVTGATGCPGRIPLIPLIVFSAIAVGTTTAMAVLCAANGWTIESPPWAVLGAIAMWAPAVGALIARRTVDREWEAGLPLREWGPTGARVIVRPLVVTLVVYGAAYAVMAAFGLAHWSPGGGKWTTTSQIVTNVVVNLLVLGAVGTLTAMGEELGWRGYLQPRLDAAGVRTSLLVLCLVQIAYHAPVMAFAGYANVGSLGTSLALFAAAELPWTFIAASESYRARSVWPAIFFHSFHNTVSQWLFPKFFAVPANQLWLQGEDGILPAVGYALVAAALWLSLRRAGFSWSSFARDALASVSSVSGDRATV